MPVCTRYLVATILFLGGIHPARADPGQPDPAFGIGGSATAAFDLGGANEDLGQLLAVDALGRPLLIGTVSAPITGTCLGIARFTAAGKPDAGYGIGGVACHDVLPAGFRLFPTDAAMLPDGRLVLAGVDDGSGHPALCAFTATGAADSAGFGEPATPGCMRIDSVDVMSALPVGAPDMLGFVAVAVANDRIHLAIQVNHAAPSRIRVRTARTTLAGVRLPFGQDDTRPVLPPGDTTPSLWLSDLALDAKGRLLLTGAIATKIDYSNDIYVARLHATSGALDPSFGDDGPQTFGLDAGGSRNDVPTVLALLPRGRLLVAGAAETAHGMRPFAAMLDDNGVAVAGFHGGTPALYDPCVFYFGTCRIFVTGAAALANNRLLLSGYAVQDATQRMFTLRTAANGQPDPGYGSVLPGQTGVAFVANALPQRARSLHMQGGAPLLGGWRNTQGAGARDFLVTRLQP